MSDGFRAKLRMRRRQLRKLEETRIEPDTYKSKVEWIKKRFFIITGEVRSLIYTTRFIQNDIKMYNKQIETHSCYGPNNQCGPNKTCEFAKERLNKIDALEDLL